MTLRQEVAALCAEIAGLRKSNAAIIRSAGIIDEAGREDETATGTVAPRRPGRFTVVRP